MEGSLFMESIMKDLILLQVIMIKDNYEIMLERNDFSHEFSWLALKILFKYMFIWKWIYHVVKLTSFTCKTFSIYPYIIYLVGSMFKMAMTSLHEV